MQGNERGCRVDGAMQRINKAARKGTSAFGLNGHDKADHVESAAHVFI